MGKKQKKKKRVFSTILLIFGIIVCLCVFAVSAYKIISKYLNDRSSENTYSEIREDVIIENETGGDEDDDDEKIPFDLDWDKLKEINEDIVAWLYIPCLDISYPVLQGETNDDYIHTTVYGTYSYAGTLFLECENSEEFINANSIIYGHNMANGSMFGILDDIIFDDAASADPYFWIYTPKEVYKYKIFSAYTTDTSSSVYTLFQIRNNDFVNWCYEMMANSYVDFGESSFDYHSSVVTLSTCYSTSATKRNVVQGVLESTYSYEDGKEIPSEVNDEIEDY